ncbi:hypothetical protein [Pseudactinotalea terrae]|uniref:hypothetical protein n=1 Tax=Pseudactinotalea terrae TaxID=1743262 RepID=UPI0012E2BBB3|nr:hypothetical protein [Pseudactinotalea terrae]
MLVEICPEGSFDIKRSGSEEPISILAEQKLGVSIRPKGILQDLVSFRHDADSKPKPIGVYLASIFDTLLSSQGADAHHRRPLGLCWGNLSTLDHLPPARQLGGFSSLAGIVRLVVELVLSSKAGILSGSWPRLIDAILALLDPIVVPLRGPAGSSRLRPSVPPLWGATR